MENTELKIYWNKSEIYIELHDKGGFTWYEVWTEILSVDIHRMQPDEFVPIKIGKVSKTLPIQALEIELIKIYEKYLQSE